jgi:hypothetical protein
MADPRPVSDAEAILDELRRHPLMGGVVPDRRRLSYRDLAGGRPQSAYEPSIRALELVPSWSLARDLVRELGALQYAPAVPTLVHLWERCPVVPVVHATGYALFEIGTSEAHAALQNALEEADHFFTTLAIKSIVATDPGGAFDRLERYFSEDEIGVAAVRKIAGEILWFFGPTSHSRQGTTWSLPCIPTLLRQDSRWVRLALRLRRHRTLGGHARHLLEGLEQDELQEMLRRWPDPPAAPRPYVGARDFLARYQRGEHRAAWTELLALGPLADDALRMEAAAVAHATMKRVRTNVEIVTARLRACGYPFDSFLPAWSPPAPDVESAIRRIEAAAGGPVPASLRAFWTVVGEVHWKHTEDEELDDPPWGRDLSMAEADPLYVLSPANAYFSVQEWQDLRAEHHPEAVGPLQLELSPDHLHKANISGGAPYAITLPGDVADAILENEAHELPFVDYLRLSFQWGGFPLLESVELSDRARSFVDDLRRDLIRF